MRSFWALSGYYRGGGGVRKLYSYLSFQLQGHLYRGDKKHSSSTKDPPSHPKVGDSSVRSWGCKHACAPGLVGLHLSLLILSWALQFLPILASSWARTPCTCSAACHLLPNSNRNGAEGASGLPNRFSWWEIHVIWDRGRFSPSHQAPFGGQIHQIWN